MLGAIIGDIAGSVYEFSNHRSKEFEFFRPGTDFTDACELPCARRRNG